MSEKMDDAGKIARVAMNGEWHLLAPLVSQATTEGTTVETVDLTDVLAAAIRALVARERADAAEKMREARRVLADLVNAAGRPGREEWLSEAAYNAAVTAWQTAKDYIALPIPDAAPEPQAQKKVDVMTDDQIKHMAERFLQWRLPEDFNPDGGISFKATYNENNAHGWPIGKNEPVGTNLFSFTQAVAMIRHMLEGLPVAPEPQAQRVPEGWKLVPIEPTEAMIEAGWIDKEDVDPDDIYAAMLAAAPAPLSDGGTT